MLSATIAASCCTTMMSMTAPASACSIPTDSSPKQASGFWWPSTRRAVSSTSSASHASSPSRSARHPSCAPLTSILPPPGATIAARWKPNTRNWPPRPAPSPAKQPHSTGPPTRQPGERTKKNTFRDSHNKKKRFCRTGQQKNAPSPAYHHRPQQKKANSLFATRQPATSHQKKANMGRCQQKKRLFSSKVLCNALHPAFTGRAFFMENVRQSFFPRRSACSQPLFSRIKRIGNQGEYEETER